MRRIIINKNDKTDKTKKISKPKKTKKFYKSGILGDYLKIINSNSVYCTEDEKKMFRLLNKEGNEVKKKAIKDDIFEHYLVLVLDIVKKFPCNTLGSTVHTGIFDQVQVASMSMYRAIDKFDLSYGCRFSTFAYPVVNNDLRQHRRKVSRHLRTFVSTDGVSFVNESDDGIGASAIDMSITISEIFDFLNSDEETLIGMYYLDMMSLSSIGCSLGITKQGVSARLKKILGKLGELFEEREFEINKDNRRR